MREEAEKMKLELQNAKEEQLRINQQLSADAEIEKLKLIK